MDLMTKEAAAKKLGLTEGSLMKMVQRETIPHIRLSPRIVRFKEKDLDSYIESKAVMAKTRPWKRGKISAGNK